MATQNDQKSLPGQPNEQQRSLQRNSPGSGLSSGRRASALGFGMTPQEFFSTNPFSVMRRMTEEMSRVMEELGLAQAVGGRTTWAPAIEVAERDGALNVRDGMLEVTIPVPQQQKQRRSVPIESESRSQTGAQTRAA